MEPVTSCSDRWAGLRLDERIAIERGLVEGRGLDGIAATSSTIRRALEEDYRYTGVIPFLPPCVDTERFHPRDVPDTDKIWGFLSQRSGLSPQEVRRCKIVNDGLRKEMGSNAYYVTVPYFTWQNTVPAFFDKIAKSWGC